VRVTGLERARRVFQEAGLSLPTIPNELSVKLKERSKWLFATREVTTSPYDLRHYVQEGEGGRGQDYAILCHSGHGVNSYALQYYLTHGALRMFLHLAWGGIYMDADKSGKDIRECFSLADKLSAVGGGLQLLQPGDVFLIVGSDFYGSYWQPPGERRRKAEGPAKALAEAIQWFKA
jgi:hypothetical protein